MCCEHGDALRAEPADDEGQDRCRGGVKPLHVVNGEQDRPHSRKTAYDRAKARGDRTLVDWPLTRLDP
jgi:hypothetical protein